MTKVTTTSMRRQPPEANTVGVFARVLPLVLAIFNTVWGGAGHPTQFGERVASLITRPAVNGGEGASGGARPAPRCGGHRNAWKARLPALSERTSPISAPLIEEKYLEQQKSTHF
jgi:hypothetical protein